MLPNGRLHALVLHPVSSIARKVASEQTKTMSKSSIKIKISYRDIVNQHIYLQNDPWRNAID